MFFKKKIIAPPTTYDWGITVDIHNHLLPGIDDGAKDREQSYLLLEGLKSVGFAQTIPTPHIASGLYLNNLSTIRAAHDHLSGEPEEKIWAGNKSESIAETQTATNSTNRELAGMVTGFAAEYMLDDYFEKLIEEEGLNCYPNTSVKKYVLIEFPYMGLPYNWHNAVFKLRSNGYQPILAHPERYTFLKVAAFVDKFAATGLLFQLNLLSLCGYYGKEVKNNALFLLNEGLYNFAGTDAHHGKHILNLQKMKEDPAIAELLKGYSFDNNLLV